MHFVLKEKPHDVFVRRGDDLVHRHKIQPRTTDRTSGDRGTTTTTTTTTTVIQVPLLDGSLWSRAIPAHLYRPGQSITVPDLGMPIRGGPRRGNLIVEFYLE